MLRGLRRNFKIPAYFDFDINMTRALIEEIIMKIEELGIKIRCLVCDMGNGTLLKEFNVTSPNNREYFFDNPFRRGNKIYIICDVVHLIKLFRTNILKYGIVWKHDGIQTTLDKEDLETMIERDTRTPGGIRRLYKLNINTHTRIEGMALQRVLPACQLLSSSTAACLRLDGFPDKAEIVQAIDDWFDTLDSRQRYSTIVAVI